MLTKFVCFQIVRNSRDNSQKRVFKKKFTLEEDGVYLEERMYDGSGVEVSKEEFEPTEKQLTLMRTIPAVVFLNDGLTGDSDGESEIATLKEYEQWYSKLSNADIDAERKSISLRRRLVCWKVQWDTARA